MPGEATIRVLLADDNLIVREGVKALLLTAGDLDVVGVAGDYDELVAAADATRPQVVVTDIRMPPSFTDEGLCCRSTTSPSTLSRCSRKARPDTRIC
jgi:DNA-binding NarL/FixJ family response regulator